MSQPTQTTGSLETEEELDLFLDKIKNEYKDGWTEENWEEEMEKHPFFMTKLPDESSGELPPAVEALRQLKWDPDESPKEKAIKLKEEGNLYFKVKNYKQAINSYTHALKEEISEDKELMSILHQNRSASHYHIQNYRSALNDCVFALKFNQKNIKAVHKCVDCCFALKLFSDCIKWCEKGLTLSPGDPKFKEMISKAETARKVVEKEKRKKETSERKQTDKQMKILALIKSKGIRVEEKEKDFLNLIESPINMHQKPIVVSSDGTSLIWPVVFLYPQYGQTDFIESFDENSTLGDHLNVMFEHLPDWDLNKEYRVENLQIYYENRDKHKLLKLKKELTLIEAMKHEGLIVQLGTPSFLILVKKSNFEKFYLQKYNEL